MKENRFFSFIIITIIYVLAGVVGFVCYHLLPFSMWLNLLIADISATVLTFAFSLLLKNASVYDPYWSVQPAFILTCFALVNTLNAVKIALLVAILLWAVRLTLNWAYTFKNLTHEDWRYRMLKEKTKGFYPIINFVGIHLVPTLVVYACTLPAVMLLTTAASGNIFCYIFIALALFATCLQGVSDYQMHKFQKDKKGQTFIRVGVWKHSRHPNYLGEILMWWAVGLCAFVTLNFNPICLIGATLNSLLFAFVSIPLADNKQSAKEGFEEYKKSTRALLPIKKFH